MLNFNDIDSSTSEETPVTDVADISFEEKRTRFNQEVIDHLVALRNDPTMDIREGYTRFSSLVNMEFMTQAKFVIIGAGGLGNPLFKTIMNMGAQHVVLIDDDSVGIENMASQDHDIITLGQPKVEACRDWALKHCGVEITTVQGRVSSWSDIYELAGPTIDVLITCIDNMELRNNLNRPINSAILNNTTLNYHIGSVPGLYIDCRMSAGTWHVFKFINDEDVTPYSEWFKKEIPDLVFEDTEGVQEPCTARATNFTSYSLASYLGAFLTWYGNNLDNIDAWLPNFYNLDSKETPFKYTHNFNSFEWTSITPSPRDFEQRANTVELVNQVAELQRHNNELHEVVENAWLTAAKQKAIDCANVRLKSVGEPFSHGDVVVYRYDDGSTKDFEIGRIVNYNNNWRSAIYSLTHDFTYKRDTLDTFTPFGKTFYAVIAGLDVKGDTPILASARTTADCRFGATPVLDPARNMTDCSFGDCLTFFDGPAGAYRIPVSQLVGNPSNPEVLVAAGGETYYFPWTTPLTLIEQFNLQGLTELYNGRFKNVTDECLEYYEAPDFRYTEKDIAKIQAYFDTEQSFAQTVEDILQWEWEEVLEATHSKVTTQPVEVPCTQAQEEEPQATIQDLKDLNPRYLMQTRNVFSIRDFVETLSSALGGVSVPRDILADYVFYLQNTIGFEVYVAGVNAPTSSMDREANSLSIEDTVHYPHNNEEKEYRVKGFKNASIVLLWDEATDNYFLAPVSLLKKATTGGHTDTHASTQWHVSTDTESTSSVWGTGADDIPF